ncbi:probable cytochrome P450 313a4 [Musca vetustissima]|uniref:probable cytochrome P450 313a4 n=1 Tax=Musca vetustissima TaxID=27455 RepID=UPI002AB70000|nr:probable cytochrome P450 313a4 [Musca vetustissima]
MVTARVKPFIEFIILKHLIVRGGSIVKDVRFNRLENVIFVYFCVVLFVCAWLYWLWTRRKYYALIFKLPGRMGYPLVGVALELAKYEPLEAVHKYTETFGPLRYVWMLTYPILLISEPDIIRDILTSPCCTNKNDFYKSIAIGVGKGLFSSKDPEWSVHRKHLNPAFGFKILQSFMPIFNEEVNNLVNLFKEINECQNVVTLLQDFTLNVAIRTTMGVNFAHEFGSESNSAITKGYQWIRRLLGVYEPFHSSNEENRKFIRKLINNKLNGNDGTNLNQGKSKNSNIFIDQAIELMRNNIFAEQDVENESNTIVLGAFETTANTIGYVLILLAMFPEYQQKVYEELLTIFPDGGEFEVTYANTQDMTYMDMVINESMRVLTPVPFVGRENSHDIELSNGIVIPAGVNLLINIFTTHRRKNLWGPNADQFDPDHFLPSNMEGKHPYAFIPFTKGIRNCIGWKYGLMSTKVTLAKLLRNFKFSTDFQYADLEFDYAIVLKLKHTPVLRIENR